MVELSPKILASKEKDSSTKLWNRDCNCRPKFLFLHCIMKGRLCGIEVEVVTPSHRAMMVFIYNVDFLFLQQMVLNFFKQ